jgi:hypothetical protein
MIAVTTHSAALVRRLRARAARLAGSFGAARRRGRGRRSLTDWHSATDLWPEFTGGSRDGK